jgi:hypothetical protein
MPTAATQNPYTCFVSTSVRATRDAAAKYDGTGYILSTGGGHSTLVPGSRLEGHQHHNHATQHSYKKSTKGFHVQKGPPKTLGRILKRLHKQKNTIATFWMDHTVGKWKHTLMFLIFRAWRFVATTRHKEEEKVLAIINQVRGGGERHWFGLWVRFLQESQRHSLKQKSKKMNIDLMTNLRDLEMKAMSSEAINTTLEKDLEFAEGEIKLLKGKLLISQKKHTELEKEHIVATAQLEVLNSVVSAETSTPMLVQKCKASIHMHDQNIEPVCLNHLESSKRVLSYLIKQNATKKQWILVSALVPYMEVPSNVWSSMSGDQKFEVNDEISLETLVENVSPKAFGLAWLNYQFSKFHDEVGIEKKDTPNIVHIPKDLTNGIVWAAVLDSVVSKKVEEEIGYVRGVWRKKQERVRVRELISNFRRLNIFAASKLKTALKFKEGTPGEHFAIVVEVMRKYPGLGADTAELEETRDKIPLAVRQLEALGAIKHQIVDAIAAAEHIDMSTLEGKQKSECAFEELDRASASFERNLASLVKEVERINALANHWLAAWPHSLSLWHRRLLDVTVYCDRVLLIEQGVDMGEATGDGQGRRVGTGDGNDSEDELSKNSNAVHLRMYSMVSSDKMKAICTTLPLMKEDLQEIRSMLRVQSLEMEKLFQYYSRWVHTDSTPDQHADDKLKTITQLQWWLMIEDARFVKMLPSDVLASCFECASGRAHCRGPVSFGSNGGIDKTGFAETILRLTWAFYPGVHFCESLPSFMDEKFGNCDTLYPAVDTYSKLRNVQLDTRFLNILEAFEEKLMSDFKSFGSDEHEHFMSANDVVSFLKEHKALNHRVTEKYARSCFTRVTALLPHHGPGCPQHPSSVMKTLSITFVQFVTFCICIFLADDSDPWLSVYESFQLWLEHKISNNKNSP